MDDQARAPKMTSRFEMLENAGIEIVPAEQVHEALQIIDAEKQLLAAVVVDLIMPAGKAYTREETLGGLETGLRLLRDIRDRAPHLPIVVISIRDREDIEDALEAMGVREFLPKNSDIREYVDVILRAARQRPSSPR